MCGTMDKERDQIRPKDIIHITMNCEITIQINKTTKHTEPNECGQTKGKYTNVH
jgi:hypothetical protein